MYNFYYDESEHSRVINLPTITGKNYYDSFLTVIIGWDADKEEDIKQRYLAFEEKYSERKKKGELKSDTFKSNQFIYGFSSFNKPNTEMLNELLSIIDDDFYIYFCAASKLEYLILQLFKNYHNSFIVDMDAIKYSIVKTILTYRPDDVIQSIYESPENFVDALIAFFTERIESNKKNISLKALENEALSDILIVLRDVKPPKTLKWDYHMPFIGFDKFLKGEGISDYSLIIDKEGEEKEQSQTIVAAQGVGIKNCSEQNSKKHFGLRIADMLVGIIGKLMKSLYRSLRNDNNNDTVSKTLLDKSWFDLNENQLLLYKKLYHILLEINNDWYKIYASNYSDDLISLLGLLDYMNHFMCTDEIKINFDMHPEYCNGCMCSRLSDHFNKMRNKLPIESVVPETDEYFRNSRGAKVFFDISKQPFLNLHEGKNKYYVLSVGNADTSTPIVTIKGTPENMCYRLPDQLKEWAMTLSGMAMIGDNLFPAEVIFTKIGNHYFADIL